MILFIILLLGVAILVVPAWLVWTRLFRNHPDARYWVIKNEYSYQILDMFTDPPQQVHAGRGSFSTRWQAREYVSYLNRREQT